MEATITIKLDVTDFVEDNNITIPDAESKIKEMISSALNDALCYPKKTTVSIDY